MQNALFTQKRIIKIVKKVSTFIKVQNKCAHTVRDSFAIVNPIRALEKPNVKIRLE